MEHKMISLGEQIYNKLEGEILSGSIARGEIVTEAKLSEMLCVSRTPIREAIQRLEYEHLIENDGKNTRVLGVTKEDLEDILQIRLSLEGLAVEKAVKNVTQKDIDSLWEAIEEQEFYTKKNNPERIKDMDNRFHSIIYTMSNSVPLKYTLEPLHRRIVRFRKYSISNNTRAKKSLSEHIEIFNAIKARDTKKASELALVHVKNVMENLMELVKK